MRAKGLRRIVPPVLALTLLFAAVLACSRGSSKCTATLTYQGKTYTGIGKKDDAVSFACNKYCLEDDSEYDAMYQIWLDFTRRPSQGFAAEGQSDLREQTTAGLRNNHLREPVRRVDKEWQSSS